MIKLPVIVGIGGMNAAGRSSGFHSYKRMICDALSSEQLEDTWNDLAHRMNLKQEDKLNADDIEKIKARTLVRRIEQYDPDQVTQHHKATIDNTASSVSLTLKKAKLSEALASACHIEPLDNHEIRATFKTPLNVLIPDQVKTAVSSAGSIPSGFDPGTLYHSHHHPRGLKLSIYGASDALNSLGIEWDELLKHIHPDEVSVYAGSAIAQVDEHSLAGLIAQPLCGNRINSKMMALALPEMPADFVNSYVINSVGATGNNIGACASFLYNLKQGLLDIQYGKAKVVLVGNAEAPIVPEIVEGFRIMGALATDESICELDKTEKPNNRRACRPFSTNTGFTLAESVQFFVLMDDELALKLGLTIYGSVADVFVNADANKRSIASPGVGNYITVAKATALAKAILGAEGVKKTYVQAHGTGTPQNRVTESHILNEIAAVFSIAKWPVAAIKSYVGHSIGVAGGDQLAATLGVWQYGFIPGIKTIDHIAPDVHQSNLNILLDHQYVGERGQDRLGTIINSKGFGGNNASALVLSPDQTIEMLTNKYGKASIQTYQRKNDAIQSIQKKRDQDTCAGHERIIYKFAESVMDQASVTLTPETIKLSEFEQSIPLPTKNPYEAYE